jgi:glycosyltransferase involved in cell wall biosynthesis
MSARPVVSVVTATHNRKARVAMLLEGLRRQTLSADRFEVIITDDGSSDGTAEFLAEQARRGDLQLRVHVHETPRGAAAARNTAWRTAKSPLIAFTDDDCVPTPGWLEALLEAHAPDADVIVQGPTHPLQSERHDLGPFSRTVEIYGPTQHYETCNILYPRALLERLDGLDESYDKAGEDSDLGWRAADAGAELRWAPSALVEHAVHKRAPLDALRDVHRATDGVQAYKANPALRQFLPQGVFYRRSHALFLEAALAVFLARRTPAALAFALPYALHLRSRVKNDGGSGSPVAAAAYYVAFDGAEVAATVRGAVRHRIPIV